MPGATHPTRARRRTPPPSWPASFPPQVAVLGMGGQPYVAEAHIFQSQAEARRVALADAGNVAGEHHHRAIERSRSGKLRFTIAEIIAADQQLLAKLRLPLVIKVQLAPEDPRYADLQRNVLSKLERAMPSVSVSLAGVRQYPATGSGDDSYGEVEYVYGNRSDVSRSTSPREILPLIYDLAGASKPSPAPGAEYPGYPLIANGSITLLWFFGALPLLIALCWWWSRNPRRFGRLLVHKGGLS